MSAASVRRLRGALVAIAEAGWVAVVYSALDVGLLHRAAALGILPFALAAAAGVTIARSGDRGPLSGRLLGAVVVGVAVLAGLVLEHPGTIMDGLLLPGPWCLGLAAWRGLRNADANSDDVALSSLLARGGPGLAVPWLAGTVGASGTSAFLAPALVGTLVFVAAGLAGIGLARLERLELEGGAGSPDSRLWLRLLGLVVGGTAVAGLPVAWLVGVPLRTAAAAVLGPLADAFAAATRGVGEFLRSAGSAQGSGAPSPAVPVGPAGSGSAVGVLVLVLVGVGLAVVIAALVKVARDGGFAAHPGRPVPRDEPERRFERPHLDLHLPRVGLPGFLHRRARPRTATGAYVALLGIVATDPALARAPAETVRTHARRIAPAMGYRLNLLAADYERERYGAGAVSPAETRRALRRGRDLARR